MHLFIDTHLYDIVIILFEDSKIVKQIVINNEKEHSKVLMPKIKELLNGEIPSSIIVVNGPGSFTSIRLGCTIAKTLAYTLNIPIRTINFLECLSVNVAAKEKTVGFSDKNGYYIAKFIDNDIVGDIQYLKNSEYASYIMDNDVIQDVDIDYTKVISYALGKECINPHMVNPVYIKKLDVEK